MKEEKGAAITNVFQKILDKSGLKPNKILVDKGCEFHNRSMKSWIEKNCSEIHSTYYEEKYVVAERFVRTLKIKIYKYVT